MDFLYDVKYVISYNGKPTNIKDLSIEQLERCFLQNLVILSHPEISDYRLKLHNHRELLFWGSYIFPEEMDIKSKCSYADKYKAIRAPKCGCDFCNAKWHAKRFGQLIKEIDF